MVDESLDVLPYISVKYNDSIKTATDRQGMFSIEVPGSCKKIFLFGINIESTIIYLTDTCNQVDLIMFHNGSHDFERDEQVDIERKRLFKELPKLHLEAYTKGIFTTKKACYTQKFYKTYELINLYESGN